MPFPKITAKIAETIKAGSLRGLSSAALSALVLQEHNIAIDRSSITRYLGANAPKLVRAAPKPPITSAPPASDTEQSTPLDEISTLQARIRDLNYRLNDPDVEPRLIAPLNAELRQTFASIRKADKARTEAKAKASGDTAWVVAKLRRFVSMNETGGASTETEEDSDDEVPPATGTTGG